MENNNNMRDDEFRVLGTGSHIPVPEPDEDRRRRKLGGWIALAIVALLGLGMIVFWPKPEVQDDVEGMFESRFEAVTVHSLDTLTTESPCVVKVDTIVSDHLLTLFIPHRATPRLLVGNLNDRDRKAVMTFQAADIRADNKEILGEFVLAGEQLAKGVSKKGYCAIVDGTIHVGVGETTPLLDEAISKGGFFFRQYPLVDHGEPVQNKPQNLTIRKALCEWNGQILVAVSADRLSLDEFARTLAEFGVSNAIYLVGSEFAYGWSVDSSGNREEFGSEDLRPDYQKQSYILWD
jgi:hypothetical protein